MLFRTMESPTGVSMCILHCNGRCGSIQRMPFLDLGAIHILIRDVWMPPAKVAEYGRRASYVMSSMRHGPMKLGTDLRDKRALEEVEVC